MRRFLILTTLFAALFHPASAGASERNVTHDELSATFATPNAGATGKGVVFIAGSGPTDRNGNSRLGVSANYLKELSDVLVTDGTAVLRYDKRGVAASKAAMTSESALRFGDFVSDAQGWTEWLAGRNGIACVFVLGHSEGGLVATLVAEKTRLAGLLLISSPGRPLATVLQGQFARAPMDIKLKSDALKTLKTLEAGKQVPDVNPSLHRIFRPSVQPYLISLIDIDPARRLAKLTLPTLIVSGAHDLQVTKADYDALRAARPNATAVRIPDMNHVLKDAPIERKANLATYDNPTLPLAPGLARAVTSFITETPCPGA